MGVRGAQGHDVGAEEEGLTLLDGDVALLDLYPALAQALHLPALQGDTRLIALFDEKVVTGLFVQRDCGAAGVFLFGFSAVGLFVAMSKS